MIRILLHVPSKLLQFYVTYDTALCRSIFWAKIFKINFFILNIVPAQLKDQIIFQFLLFLQNIGVQLSRTITRKCPYSSLMCAGYKTQRETSFKSHN